MSLTTERREIGRFAVASQKLPVRRAAKLMVKLGRIVGPALAQAKNLPAMTKLTEWSAMLPLLGALFENMDDRAVDELLRDGLQATTVVVDGEQHSLASDKAIDQIFAGDLPGLWAVLLFALEVNFADFFAGVSPNPDSKSGAAEVSDST